MIDHVHRYRSLFTLRWIVEDRNYCNRSKFKFGSYESSTQLALLAHVWLPSAHSTRLWVGEKCLKCQHPSFHPFSMSISSQCLLFRLRNCESAGSIVVTKCAPNSLKKSAGKVNTLHAILFGLEAISIYSRCSSWKSVKALVHVWFPSAKPCCLKEKCFKCQHTQSYLS